MHLLLNRKVVRLSLQVTLLQYLQHPPNQTHQTVQQQQYHKGTNRIPNTHIHSTRCTVPNTHQNQKENLHKHKQNLLDQSSVVVRLGIIRVENSRVYQLRLHHPQRLQEYYETEVDQVKEYENNQRCHRTCLVAHTHHHCYYEQFVVPHQIVVQFLIVHTHLLIHRTKSSICQPVRVPSQQ